MKRKFLISLILLSSVLTMNGQWNGTNPIYTNSNVGVGTLIPASKFSVDISSGLLSSSSSQSNYNILLGQNISATNGEGAGIAFTVYQGASPGNYPSYTPGAAIVHERTGSNSKGKLHFRVKTTIGSIDALTTSMTISDNGNVGIGTTNPQDAKLHIEGSGTYDAILRLKNTGEGGGDWSIITTKSDWTAGAGNLLFASGGASSSNSKLVITSDGKIGIGTYNMPGNHKLYVAGSIISEEIKVKFQTDWPDFVFYPDYNLRSISELDQYIKENNHLPEMPTSEEISKCGINLGEMNAKLLKKIEELTIYTIEQNKKIE